MMLLFFFTVLAVLIVSFEAKQSLLKIINTAGNDLDILWHDDETNHFISIAEEPLKEDMEVVMNSFEGHRFRLRLTTGIAETMFTKGSKDETIVIVYDTTLNSLSYYNLDEAEGLRRKVKSNVMKSCLEIPEISNNPEELKKCITNSVTDYIRKAHESKNLLRKYQNDVSNQLRNYSCADLSLETPEPISSYDISIDSKPYTINNLLDLSHAKIWYVNNFITPEECKVLEDYGRPRLTRATVAAEDGTSIVSENRKANQAGYDLHQAHGTSDPLWKLQQRILSLVNYHANFSLEPPGQEGFTIIQYNPTDEYYAHCDGACDNGKHISTGRVATAVMYCKEPTKGGQTLFTRSNIIVKPKFGSATFFSYLGPDDRMDDGFTEHSGCPVIEGEKWITTFWMRKGVTEEENWQLYDPMGVRILESQSG